MGSIGSPRRGAVCKMRPDFLHVGLEGVGHRERITTSELERRPIDDVGVKEAPFRAALFPFLGWSARQQMADEFTATKCTGVARWMLLSQLDRFIGRHAQSAAFFEQAEVQAFVRMEIV